MGWAFDVECAEPVLHTMQSNKKCFTNEVKPIIFQIKGGGTSKHYKLTVSSRITTTLIFTTINESRIIAILFVTNVWNQYGLCYEKVVVSKLIHHNNLTAEI